MALLFYAGNILTAPHQHAVEIPDSILPIENVVIERDTEAPLKGWLIRGKRAGVVILLHSIRSDRREMLGRAKFLYEAGYSVFLPDMQAHGATIGQRITWGFRESRDVRTALAYIREQFAGDPVGIIGVSLGGAASLLGNRPVEVEALILESVYSHIEQAIENRLQLHLGQPGKMLTPLLSWQIEATLGISLSELSPLAAIKNLSSPVLIIGGTDDRHTTTEETQALFDSAPDSKSMWLIDGAAHENLHRYAALTYQQRILDFLNGFLRGEQNEALSSQ
jgi:pimeloyl-ACP methyl ester carboxylesterase